MWQALPAVIALAGAAFLPGALLLWLTGRQRVADLVSFSFAALSLGLLVFGWIALALAEVGWYSLPRLALIWSVVVVALSYACLVAHRRRTAAGVRAAPGLRIERWEAVALGVWLLAACVLYFRPHQTITGGADVGVYVNLGANIARTGRILISDPSLAALDPVLDAAFLRALPPSEGAPYYLLPGFYVPGAPRGLIVPQFYPLHPVWLAVGHDLGGVRAALLMTPLWGMLGALAVYMTVRRLWGWKVGLLALIALSLTALQVWFARYATAEMLTQYLVWTGVWALIGWVDDDEPRWLWPAIAGIALGEVFLTRIDMYALLMVPVVAAVWRWRTHSWQRTDALLLGPFILLALHSLLHGALQSGPYTASLFHYVQIVVFTRLKPLAALGAAAIALTVFVAFAARRRRSALGLQIQRLPWGWIAALLVIALALYAYLVRPHLGQVLSYAYWYGGGQLPDVDRENLVRLGWYLSPLGVALGVLGTAWMLVKEANRRTAFLLGAGLFFSLLYLWRIQANPHQIYAMRRYVPVVLPFFVIAATYVLYRLSALRRHWARGLSLGLTLLWLFGIVWSSRGFVSQVDLRNAIAQMDRLNALFEPRSVLLFGDAAPVGMGDLLGTPLRFLYGHDVYPLRTPGALDEARFDEALARWRDAGRQVYWIGVPEGPSWPGRASLGPTKEFTFEAAVLENTYDHKPTRVDVTPWRITVAPVATQP
jgi:4-amino-4-deoxy-L-arabinose transferase-like glycosyltransferase